MIAFFFFLVFFGHFQIVSVGICELKNATKLFSNIHLPKSKLLYNLIVKLFDFSQLLINFNKILILVKRSKNTNKFTMTLWTWISEGRKHKRQAESWIEYMKINENTLPVTSFSGYNLRLVAQLLDLDPLIFNCCFLYKKKLKLNCEKTNNLVI